MKQITKKMADAFINGKCYKNSNTEVVVNHYANCGTLTQIYLFGNCIAQHDENGLQITNAGWFSVTTKERLNALPGVSICQKNYKWFLNGNEWSGEWTKVG